MNYLNFGQEGGAAAEQCQASKGSVCASQTLRQDSRKRWGAPS